MKKQLLLTLTFSGFLQLANAQPGHLDPSFGDHGIAATDIGQNYDYGTTAATQVLLPSDGSIFIIQQQQNFISKRLSDGSRDVSYGRKGYSSSAGFNMNIAALQSDNKIVAAGDGIARYDFDGKLDDSFANDGKQKSSFIVNAVAIQKNGNIVTAGVLDNYLSLARYKKDGSPDSSFGSDGLLKSDLPYYYDNPASIAIQSDGKIIVTGSFTPIVRFNSDGSMDNSFNNNIQNFPEILSAAIQNNGKIVVIGYAADSTELGPVSYAAVGRYNIDGSPDTSFSNDGKQKTDFEVTSLALQNDGKIVVTGNVYMKEDNGSFYSHFAISRYNIDGTPDESFATLGTRITDLGTDAEAKSVAIQSDGKIVVAGGAKPLTSAYAGLDIAIARYKADGTLDNTFDEDGKLTDHYHAGHTVYKKIVVKKDGKIVTAGSIYDGTVDDMAIVTYNANGSLDKSFSNDGIQTTGFTGYDEPMSLAVQSDGKIIASSKRSIARYKTDGSLDSTFSQVGQQRAYMYIHASAVQSDGKILIVGNDPNNVILPSIGRLNNDGSLDKTFSGDGKKYIPLSADHQGGFSSVKIQKDGKIVMAGILANIFYDKPNTRSVILARLNTDGNLDTTFDIDGVTTLYAGGYATDCSIAVESDGKIVLATNEYNNGAGGTFLTRFNTDGSIDSSFIDKREHRHANYSYTSVAIQSDGKIVISGSDLLRFNTDGSLDNGFNINADREVDFDINAITISENKLYAAGGLYLGSVARYLLESTNTAPTVSLAAPANNATYLAPAAHIKLSAAASDADGTISKVEFYKGATLLHTETVIPYGYTWRNVPLGNYTVTAKAYDNSGNVTTSSPVYISVVQNTPPAVSIIKPANNQSFTAPAYIHFEAAASDTDGRITRVEFYKDSTLLRTEYKYPYSYNWTNVAAGTYTITAVATDNWGAQTTSAPVTVRVTLPGAIVSGKPYSETEKTALNDALSLRLSPNPATNVVNIFVSGLQQNKPATLSIISTSGIVLKTIQISNAATQLNVSALTRGVYTIKIIKGDKVLYKQFVKL